MRHVRERFACSAKVPGYEFDELVVEHESGGHLWLEMHRPCKDQAISISLNAGQARRLAALLLEFADEKQKGQV